MEKLNQGFSNVSDTEGRAIKDVDRVSLHQTLKIQVANGELTAEVTGKERREWK